MICGGSQGGRSIRSSVQKGEVDFVDMVRARWDRVRGVDCGDFPGHDSSKESEGSEKGKGEVASWFNSGSGVADCFRGTLR